MEASARILPQELVEQLRNTVESLISAIWNSAPVKLPDFAQLILDFRNFNFGGNHFLDFRAEQNLRSFSSVFRWKLGHHEILQKLFSDGQGHTFQKFIKFFFWKLGPLGIIWKWFSDGQGKTNISEVSQFVFWIMTHPPENHENTTRPNGTPLMPVLRSRSTVKVTVRKKTWSGG